MKWFSGVTIVSWLDPAMLSKNQVTSHIFAASSMDEARGKATAHAMRFNTGQPNFVLNFIDLYEVSLSTVEEMARDYGVAAPALTAKEKEPK